MKDQLLKQFAEIIKKYGAIPAATYDNIPPPRPSRRVICKHFGKWRDAVVTAVEYLNMNGDNTPTPITPGPDIQPQLIEAEEQVKKLQRQVQELTRHIQTPKLCIEGFSHKFGYITDTHIGSLYADYALLNSAYEVFEQKKIKTVFHSGDITDGQKMFKGHEFELEIMGADNQVNAVCERYPRKKGITTYYITGNHDWSFYKDGGNDIGHKIAKERPDMVYLGHQEADITLGEAGQAATVRLSHPDGGTAYAISYHMQQYISSLPPGTKPDILLQGHYHKSLFLPFRGVYGFHGGTTQHQTPFMRGRKLAAIMGFYIIDVLIAPDRVLSVGSHFYPVRT